MKTPNLRTIALAATAAICALTLGTAANAYPRKAEASQFVVLHQNTFIPFSRQIESWDSVGPNTVLIRTTSNRWYRATTPRVCASELRGSTHLALLSRGGSIDTGTRFRVNGMTCWLNSIDEIENPYRQTASRY